MKVPLIQGGMGVSISTWLMARIVSLQGYLGTVSGVAAEIVLARNLQAGDPGGYFRHALMNFPFPKSAERVFNAYYVKGGIPREGGGHKHIPTFNLNPSRDLIDLVVCANFALCFLAKEGHSGLVSINYLDKIRLPHIYSFVGAMLSGVDCITMGAGIPQQVPEILDSIVAGKELNYRIPVEGEGSDSEILTFNPQEHFGEKLPPLKRPAFLPIVSSDTLANYLLNKTKAGSIQGFVFETSLAGGHNAPPRGKLFLDENREPIYGERDEIDFSKMGKLGVPFWVGGGCASPKSLDLVRRLGAEGIQVGSAFALSRESGFVPEIRKELLRRAFQGTLEIRTDHLVSPTGFPFKVASLPYTMSEDLVYRSRQRRCVHKHLSTVYRQNGQITTRCLAGRIDTYLQLGGFPGDIADTRCLCSGLLSAAGIGDFGEPAIVTLGSDLSFLPHLMRDENDIYGTLDVIKYIMGS